MSVTQSVTGKAERRRKHREFVKAVDLPSTHRSGNTAQPSAKTHGSQIIQGARSEIGYGLFLISC